MRTVREFSRAGISGIHIEDQLYPKRAHYHKNVAHAIPREEFVDKIKYAGAARDETDKDFVIIARTDTCRFEGLEEAITRLNMAADVGADIGLFFPRNDEEMKAGPKRSRIPLVYVTSRGNRDGRPLPTASELADMGYKACIDAITTLVVNFHYSKKCLQEIYRTGTYTGMSFQENINTRQQIENLVGVERFYEIEEGHGRREKVGEAVGFVSVGAWLGWADHSVADRHKATGS
jgi:2-methylisocitrate lyase-like PEP mutase family enzyme